MSAAKHTPGPWSVLEHQGEVFVLASGAMQIAKVTYVLEFAGEQGSRRLQNARMFAAAPEMLEALQLASNTLFLLADEVKTLGLRAENVREKVRAAIAKATGSAAV